MNIKQVLELDPKDEYEICYSGHKIWKHSYFQMSDSYEENEVDPNDLPVLDDKYINEDAGELLYNDKGEAVFDPQEEIKYESDFEMEYEMIYKSKTFIGLFQEKIKELELETDDNGNVCDNEILDKLMIHHGVGFIESLFDSVKCNDKVCILENWGDLSDHPYLLWFTSTMLDEELGELTIDGDTILTNYL